VGALLRAFRPSVYVRDVRRLSAIAAALVVVAGLTACGDDDDDIVSGDDPTTTAAASSTTSSSFPGGTTPVSEPPPDDLGVALLTDLRVAGHPDEGLERVVLEFRNGVPGYEVALAEPPFTEDGSGDEVAVDGGGFLRVRMQPASRADLSGEDVVLTYEGPDRVTGDTEVITEVVRTGDFEAVLEWIVGLDGERAFHVYALDGPPRLVIDVAR
jgi:hypothetical protein